MTPGAQKRYIVSALLLLLIAALWSLRGHAAAYLSSHGHRAKQEWRLPAAVQYFDWAYFLSGEFEARFEKGTCLQLLGNFRASQDEYDVLFNGPNENVSAMARLHNSAGINKYSFAEPRVAAEFHTRALELARSAVDRRTEAEALIGLSRVFYHSQGKFSDALSHLETARSISREIGDESIEAAVLRNIGTVYWWFKGELDRPLNEYYLPALGLYRRQNDRRGEATMLTLIALVYNNKGDVYRFMQYQQESIAIQEQIGDEAGLSDSYISMGQMYDGIGNYRKAGEFYRKGLEMTERNNYRLAQIDLTALMAQVHINLDEFDEAIEKYDPLREHKKPDSLDFNILGVAYGYHLKGNHTQALSLYQRALNGHRMTNATDVRFETVLLFRIADCHISLGDRRRAEEYLREADLNFKKLDTHSSGQLEPALIRAGIAHGKGDHRLALDHLRDALETEERVFASASSNSLVPPERRLYDRLYKFLLEYSDSPDKVISTRAKELVFSFYENMRYRSLRNFFIGARENSPNPGGIKQIEKDLTAEIKGLSERLAQNRDDDSARDRLREVYSSLEEVTLRSNLDASQYEAIKTARPSKPADIQRNLADDSAVLEFVFAGDTIAVLVVVKDRLEVIQLPTTRSELAAKVKLFRSLLLNDDGGGDWLPVAESLRSALVGPVESSGTLRNVKRIGLVPRGFLHDLPFAALARREGESSRFLVEDYVLFHMPSAAFNTHKRVGPPGGPGIPRAALVLGRNEFYGQGQRPLEFAVDEAFSVGEVIRGRVLANSDATETSLKDLAADIDYLHVSTHAIAENDMPLLSRLLLAPSPTDDGDLTVREIFDLGLAADLVTLSACETGRSFSASGQDVVDEDRLGLIEAFLHSGSASVLASTFPVIDKATMQLMTSFYTNLGSHDKAESLALAQRWMIHSRESGKTGDVSHPRHWSPFILVGTDR